jgi:hypothetical protein
MSDLALGELFDCLKDGTFHLWVQTLNTRLKGLVYVESTRLYPFIAATFFKLLPKNMMEVQ